jgi:hypothetical protein
LEATASKRWIFENRKKNMKDITDKGLKRKVEDNTEKNSKLKQFM